ncbi:related to DPP1-diacylglycerol pyrophosphate phosphatase [Serendipita indica DSM 11827]|uniref:Related to DPP1-diacylglycerol pyrophosphate phosphatase n=1 Tax=Serendipita indica (strain DSM 11827) TaxID=1109443 RepID=G4TF34_SERID|nr:related to DPP1-diacylglycerol pyrophosphate phosphatase [Serendipita indica DSM 11827]
MTLTRPAIPRLLTLALGALFFALNEVEGFRRRFSLHDESIQYPYTLHERVPDWLLGIVCLVVPAVTMPLVNLISVRTLWDLHNSELGLILSLALAGSITNILKITAGRPRPDLIARCQPASGSENPAVFGLVDWHICTQTSQSIMRDGWRSFSSGHSSLSFAGLGYLTFYLMGKLHLFDERGHTSKSWISVFPLFGATVVAITRTMDYRHHWQDVFVGMLIGLATAYFSYRQYYPSLEHPLSHRPFAPRYAPITDAAESEHPTDSSSTVPPGDNGKGKGPDEEQGVVTSARVADEGEIDHEAEGTVPRGRPPNLERVWSEKSRISTRRSVTRTEV